MSGLQSHAEYPNPEQGLIARSSFHRPARPVEIAAPVTGRMWGDLTLRLCLQDELLPVDDDRILVSFAHMGGAPVDHGAGLRPSRRAPERGDVSIYPVSHGRGPVPVPRGLVASMPVRLVDQAARRLSGRDVANAISESVFRVRDPALLAFGAALETEMQRPDHPNQANDIAALAAALALHLVRRFGDLSMVKPRARPLSQAMLQDLDAYIDDRVTGSVHLEELAAIAGLSRFHFIRAFKATTNVTPMAYVERRRIVHACLLVASGGMTLAEIAHFLGFADQSHFTRRFKVHLGCTPGDYPKTSTH